MVAAIALEKNFMKTREIKPVIMKQKIKIRVKIVIY